MEPAVEQMPLIPLDQIHVGELDVRSPESDPDLYDLADSIASVGLLNPLGVEECDGRLTLVHGHRRYAACRIAGVVAAPCRIVGCERRRSREISFAENHFRRDLSPIEQAAAIHDVIEDGSYDAAGVARVMRRSLDWVSQQLAMLAWPADVQQAVHQRQLSPSAARHLAKITDAAYRGYLLDLAVSGGATERTTQSWHAAWQAAVPVDEIAGLELPPAVATALGQVPQAPCMLCHELHPLDGLCNVLVCTRCVNDSRGRR